ncbi:MAG TPA: hypothetical protein PK728_00660 [Bacillota bacterium]|nr:hypothetical protein [Bacillota bacterium]
MAQVQIDENRIASFMKSKNLEPVRFTEAEMKKNGRTPDFQVYKGSDLVFFCEVKSTFDDGQEDLYSTVYNKISQKIYDAVEQFNSVNAGRKYANVLALVNHEFHIDVFDLISVLKDGDFYLKVVDGGERPVLKFFEGKIREVKYGVDLFLWFDPQDTEAKFVFIDGSPFKEKLCMLLGIDKKEIKPVDN